MSPVLYPSSRFSRSSCRSALAAALLACAASQQAAADFAVTISPPRFELRAEPGQTLNEAFSIHNDDTRLAELAFRSADWTLRPDGGVDIAGPALEPGSCRPWVVIERATYALTQRATKRYRFQVNVPADAPVGECRFALLIEPAKPDTEVKFGQVQFPVSGRVAVIVYVAVGDAAGMIDVGRVGVGKSGDQTVPVVTLTNSGNATARPEGVLRGRDASGKELQFFLGGYPVLPGQTRTLPISVETDARDGKPLPFQFPVELSGTIEWQGGRTELSGTAAR
ncbi:MAG: hypothetical protein LJE97_05490 [Betaproteobacteria bacterium]|nr:hypothetical protein [Betaproteobacteria bacterium]